MSDKCFNICHGFIFPWWYCQRMICYIMAGWHVIYALLNDSQTLAHLFHTYQGPVVAVTIFPEGNIKFKFIYSGIWSFLTVIPVITGGPESRSGNSPLDGLLSSIHSYTYCSCFKNPVFNNYVIKFFKSLWQIIYKILHELVPSIWQIMGNATNSEP